MRAFTYCGMIITDNQYEILAKDIVRLCESDIITYDKMNGVEFYVKNIEDYTEQNTGNGINGWTHKITCSIIGDHTLPPLPTGTEFIRKTTSRGEFAQPLTSTE